MTSATHQPPGSSRATPILNQNARPPGFIHSSPSSQTRMPLPQPSPRFVVTGAEMKPSAP